LRFERQHSELKIYRAAIPVRVRNNTPSKSKLRQKKRNLTKAAGNPHMYQMYKCIKPHYDNL